MISIYEVDDEYIEYLRKFDKKVMSSKNRRQKANTKISRTSTS